jgi:hypothetical protein
MPNNFLGHDGFIWFIGVVEDRDDPTKTGRVRVRCLGYHTDDKTALPTSDLPWASVMLPITSSGISGIGQTPLGLVEGSWVIGFFKDGQSSQEPIILGSLPGRPTEMPNTAKGFYDPSGQYPRYTDRPDVNDLATAISEPASLNTRIQARETDITGVLNTTWNMPEITAASQYPHNHVYETESGHLLEFDDTANATRIHLRHNTGTSIELTNDGNSVAITKGSAFIQIDADNKIYIKGNKAVTVDGNSEIKVKGDYKLDVDGTIKMWGSTIDFNGPRE